MLNSPRAWGISQRASAPRTALGITKQIAERKAREEAGERDGWGPDGYKWRQWDHLREEKRRSEMEAQGRASVAVLDD